MKIAISGKGGVGKTTVTAILARLLQQAGYRVLLIDADPDANLAATLGFPNALELVPIVEMKELIQERMGLEDLETVRSYFRLNPQVDDIPERYSHEHDGLRLLVMGEIRQAGRGCACPENTFVRELMAHLLLEEKDVVLMDMEAGIEHLGRGTARAVDLLLVVVEPGLRSMETARKIRSLAAELGIAQVWAVANRVRCDEERALIAEQLKGWNLLGFLPYSEGVAAGGRSATGLNPDQVEEWEGFKEVLGRIIP
jgi:CO dehydrogenase maturation factor